MAARSAQLAPEAGNGSQHDLAWVPRRRLIASIAGERATIVLAVAPAGWGKTTLLDEWIQRQNGPVARLDCTGRMSDVDAFLTQFARACARATAVPESTWHALADADGRPAADRLRTLLSRLPVQCALSLDDAHVIPADAPAHSLLAELTEAARRGTTRLFIAARTMPAFISARDLVHGMAMRLDARALAMSREEIGLFFRGTSADGDAEFIAAAAQRTEGWPAGLRMLRHRLLREDRATALTRAGQDADALGAYFDVEILEHLDPAQRAALDDVALLDSIDHEGCVAVDATGALPLIGALAADALFVAPTPTGFRLHPMLRDHLRERSRQCAPQRVADRLCKISDWHRSHERTREALEAALDAWSLADATASPDAAAFGSLAAARLEEAMPNLLETGRRDIALATAARLPVPSLRARPYLLRLLALVGSDRGDVGDTIADTAPRADAARCIDLVLRARAALQEGRITDVAAAALAARDAVPASDPFLRNLVVSLLQGAFRFGGDPLVGEAAVTEAERLANEVRRPAAAVQAGAMLGILQIMHGRLHAAEDALRRALALADAKLDADAPVRGLAHQFLGYALCEWDRMPEAAEHLEHARRIGEAYAHHGILTGTLRVLAGVRLRLGQRAAANEAMDGLVRLVDRPDTDARNREWLDGVRAAFAIDTRDPAALSAWLARRAYAPATVTALPASQLHARIQEYTTLAQALLVLGRHAEAAALARALARAAHDAGRIGFQVVAGATLAAAAEMDGRKAEADDALRDALRAAAPESMLRAIADTPGPLSDVLARVPADVVPAVFLDALRRSIRTGASAIDLTDRERDVLFLLADGGSNKSMARALGVSISTVKTHLHHVFRKLNARNRTHALARARALGLLTRASDPTPFPHA